MLMATFSTGWTACARANHLSSSSGATSASRAISALIAAPVVARTRFRSVLPRRVFAEVREYLTISFSFAFMGFPGRDDAPPGCSPCVNDDELYILDNTNRDPT